MLRTMLRRLRQQVGKAFVRRPRQARRFRPGLEWFEERALLATAIWTGALDDLWTNPENWNIKAVPGANDTAVFDDTAIGTFVTVNPAFAGTVGELRVAASWSGTIALGRTLTVSGAFELGGGNFEGDANVQLNGNGTWTGGRMAGTGNTTLAAGRTLTIDGDRDKALDTRVLVNNGTILWLGRGSIQAANNGVIDTRVGATLEARADVSFLHVAGEVPSSLRVAGTFRKTAGAGTLRVTGTLVNSGSVDVTSGTLNLAAGGSSTSAISAGVGARVVFSGDTFTLNTGASLTGNGTARLTNGTVLVAAANVPARNFQMAGGTLDGTGTFTVSGALTWTGGRMVGAGTTAVAAGATLTLSGFAPKTLDTRTLTNAGSGTWTGTGDFLTANSSTFTNLTGATFDIRTDADLVHTDGSMATVTNVGTLRKAAGTSYSTFLTSFVNAGLVEVQTGTLILAAGGINRGTLYLETGTTLLFPTETYIFETGSAVAGGGTMVVRGAILQVDGTNVSVDILNLISGTITGPGNLTVNYVLYWTGGIMNGTGTTHMASGGFLLILGDADKYLDTRTLRNAGEGYWLDAGNVVASNGSTFHNLAGANFTIYNDANFRQDGNITATITNAGNFVKGFGITRTVVSVRLVNTGTVDVQYGALTLAGGGSNHGPLAIAAGMVLTYAGDGAPFTLETGTTITGDGLLRVVSGTVEVRAAVVSLRNLNFEGGVLNGSGELSANTLVWTGGEMSGTGITRVPPGALLRIDGAQDKLLNRRTLSNAGLITWTGTGQFTVDNEALLDNLVTGAFEIRNDSNINAGVGKLASFRNAGTLRKLPISSTTISIPIQNTGTVEVTAGTLVLSAGGSQRGRFTLGSTAVLVFTADVWTLQAGSTINGTGNVIQTGGTLIVSATMSIPSFTLVGGTLRLTPAGILNIQGGYVQGPDAWLLIEFLAAPSGQWGQLNATGALEVDGTLEIVRLNNFLPSLGDAFAIVNGGSLTGAFSTISGLDLPQSRRLTPIYSATGLRLLTELQLGPRPGGEGRRPASSAADPVAGSVLPNLPAGSFRRLVESERGLIPRGSAPRPPLEIVDQVFGLDLGK